MNAIDERAEAFATIYPEEYKHFAEDCYSVGANEQKILDEDEYRKDMQYVNIKKQELMERIRKAYCAHHCPHLVEYCWQDETDIPCAGMRAINKAMEE